MLETAGRSVPWSAIFVCLLATLDKVAGETLKATCMVVRNTAFTGSDDRLTGTVKFTQQASGGDTTIAISIGGFSMTDRYRTHGFHIHQSDNMTVGCNSLGGHYNPRKVDHGGPTAAVRHYGDLGNVVENAKGVVTETKTDRLVALSGTYSVIGRSVVIHQKEDDLGLGGNAGSRTTGNAGSRLGCCIIRADNGVSFRQINAPLMALCIAALFKIHRGTTT